MVITYRKRMARVNFMQNPRKDDRVRCPSRVNKINDRAGSLVAADDRSRDGHRCELTHAHCTQAHNRTCDWEFSACKSVYYLRVRFVCCDLQASRRVLQIKKKTQNIICYTLYLCSLRLMIVLLWFNKRSSIIKRITHIKILAHSQHFKRRQEIAILSADEPV